MDRLWGVFQVQGATLRVAGCVSVNQVELSGTSKEVVPELLVNCYPMSFLKENKQTLTISTVILCGSSTSWPSFSSRYFFYFFFLPSQRSLVCTSIEKPVLSRKCIKAVIQLLAWLISSSPFSMTSAAIIR